MVIESTIKITIPDNGIDVNRLETLVREAVREAGKGIFTKALAKVEEAGLEKAELIKQRRRSRWVMTGLGWISVERYVVYDPVVGEYYCWLDRAVGLKPCSKLNGTVRGRGAELAVEHSYRKAAELLSAETGEGVSHTAVWNLVQDEGQILKEEIERSREAVFGRGEAPRKADEAAPALVVGEMDGTMIRLQRGRGNTEVKVGVMYSRKEKTGKNRRRVADKVVFAAIEPIDEFAESWYLMGEERFRISEAGNLLLITDGLDIYRETVKGYFPDVVHQLDRWHLNEKIGTVVQDVAVEKKLSQMLNEGRERDVLRFFRMHEFPGREEKATELVRYIENNLDSINAVRTLPKDPATSSLRRTGSGVIEKTVGTLVASRFKGHGRFWSPQGAGNLLRLRVNYCNSHYPLKGERTNSKPNPCGVNLN